MSEIYSTLSYLIKLNGKWEAVVKHLTEKEHNDCLAGKYRLEGCDITNAYNVCLEIGESASQYRIDHKPTKKPQPNKKWYQSPRSRW